VHHAQRVADFQVDASVTMTILVVFPMIGTAASDVVVVRRISMRAVHVRWGGGGARVTVANGVVVRTVPAFGHPSLRRPDMLLSRCMFELRVGNLLAIRATSQQPAAPPRRIRAAPRLATTRGGKCRCC
jgi:hypothetical protein